MYAQVQKHVDDVIGNGSYMPTIFTYKGTTKINTYDPNTFTWYSVIIPPTVYVYYACAKSISDTGATTVTMKILENFMFDAGEDFYPVGSWNGSASVTY